MRACGRWLGSSVKFSNSSGCVMSVVRVSRGLAPRCGGVGRACAVRHCGAPRRWAAVSSTAVPTGRVHFSGSSSSSPRLPKLHCDGCGVRMQSSNKLSVGYYQEPRFKEGENGDAGSAPKRICQRCFAMKHYSKLVPAVVPHESFRDSVAALRRTAAPGSLFVYVVDATDFPGSVVPDLTDLVGPDKRLLVVVNKCDLLPRSVSWKRLEIWVRTHLKELDARLGNNVDEVAFVSALTGYGIRRLVSRIHAMRRGGDVFTVGAANVGKSSCINQLLNIMWNIPESSRRKAGSRSTSIPGIKAPPVKTVPLTTSPLPGTTLGTVTAPLPNQGSIFDTPGIIVDPEKQALLEILAHDGSRTLRDALPAKHTKVRKPHTALQ